MFYQLTTFTAYGRLILLLVLFFICSKVQADYIYVVNSESRTLSRIDTSTDIVQNNFAQLGVIPNKVIIDENYLWVVNSGDNAVQKINRQTGATLANIFIEAGCNPWDAVLDGDFLYVTGLFTNKVYKVHAVNHNVVGFVEVGLSPEALCIYNGKLYVTNTGGWQNNYAYSSVSVIDLGSFQVTATIPFSANPQYIIEHDGLIHVSCTGNWTNIAGKVCIINPQNNELVQTINLGGSLGGIWIDNNQQALVGDGSGLYFYRYDASNFSILNDNTNPLTPGGSVICGNNELTALLYPNWTGYGSVRILHPDLSYWKEYVVGLAPTDMKLWQTTTHLNDDVSLQMQIKVYPNPVKKGQDIIFELDQKTPAELKIYNIKGQLVYTQKSVSGQFLIDNSSFSLNHTSGLYLYKIKTYKTQIQGKLTILK